MLNSIVHVDCERWGCERWIFIKLGVWVVRKREKRDGGKMGPHRTNTRADYAQGSLGPPARCGPLPKERFHPDLPSVHWCPGLFSFMKWPGLICPAPIVCSCRSSGQVLNNAGTMWLQQWGADKGVYKFKSQWAAAVLDLGLYLGFRCVQSLRTRFYSQIWPDCAVLKGCGAAGHQRMIVMSWKYMSEPLETRARCWGQRNGRCVREGQLW